MFLPLLMLAGSLAGSTEKPKEIRIEKDIVYCKAGDEKLMLDLARPQGKGPFPLVVCLHGGAWQLGHRSAHHATIRHLAQNGFAAATVSYRLTPKHRWPTQLHDAKCAVRYLRSRSKELDIDSERVAALGDSAGGHLSLLLGLTDARDKLEGSGGYEKYSSKVQAVVNYYGPTDLRTWKPTPAGDLMLRAVAKGKGGDALLRDFAGTDDRKAKVMTELSPVTYIDRDDPPILTIHGTNDPLVDIEQARTLHEALRKAGVKEQLEVIKGGGHGFQGKERERISQIVLKFLKDHLTRR